MPRHRRSPSITLSTFRGAPLLPRERDGRNKRCRSRRDPDQARQPLGTARAGDHAQRDFRQSDEVPARDACIATQAPLVAAAERCAVDSGDHGFCARLDCGDDGRQLRLFEGLAELAESEPAMNVLPPPMITAAYALSSSTVRIASSRPWRTSSEPALTGGLSTTTMATSPSRSTRTGLGGASLTWVAIRSPGMSSTPLRVRSSSSRSIALWALRASQGSHWRRKPAMRWEPHPPLLQCDDPLVGRAIPACT